MENLDWEERGFYESKKAKHPRIVGSSTNGSKKEELPKWEGESLFSRGTFYRWNWRLQALIKERNPNVKRRTIRRNAAHILCYLLNLARKKHIGNVRRKEGWDGWMKCTLRYVERGTDISVDEQRAAFPLLERWVRSKRRGMPGKRWCKIDIGLLQSDLDEYLDTWLGLNDLG